MNAMPSTQPPQPSITLGIDVGGQSVKLGIVDQVGQLSYTHRVPLHANDELKTIRAAIVNAQAGVRANGERDDIFVDAIGVMFPGYMDRDRTQLEFAANLPALSGSSILADLRERFDVPVVFDADCNAALVAEAAYGVGCNTNRLLFVTVGTGIGGAVMIDNEIVRLRGHIAGSLGHVCVDPKGPTCACGRRGCVEALAAGPAVERLATERAQATPESPLGIRLLEKGSLTGQDIAWGVSQHDQAAIEAITTSGRWLGVAIATWEAIYKPQVVALGGGVAQLGSAWLEAVQAGWHNIASGHNQHPPKIVLSQLGSDAGIIGAGVLARTALNESLP